MTIREEIAALSKAAEADGITLTAEAVVEAARDREAYPKLHEHLWEVSTQDLAAEARLARAYKLIIQLRIITQDGTTTRMYVHTPDAKGYRPAESVAKNVDLASAKFDQLQADIARARQRLRGFRAILADDVAGEIDDALRKAEEAVGAAAASRTAAA